MIQIINLSISAISVFLYSGLYIFVSTSRPQSELKRAFRWFLLAMTVWSASAFILYIDQDNSTFWFKMMTCGGIGTMVSVYRYSRIFTDIRVRWDKLVPIFGLFMIGMILFTDLAIETVSVVRSEVLYELTTYMILLAGPGYVLIIVSLIFLISHYNKTLDPIHKNRLLYLIIGIGIMIFGSSINFTPLGKYPIDIAANSITAVLIVYSILRYQLLDIRVVIRQGLVYSFPTIIIGTAYFLLITLALNIFNVYSGIEIFILSLAVAIVTAVIVEPLRNRAQKFIDRIFFREKYDAWYMLENLSSRVAMMLDLFQITNTILDEVTSTLHIRRAAFFLKEENSKKFPLAAQVGLDDIPQVSFREGHPLVLRLTSKTAPITNQDIEVLPQFQSMWKSERIELDELEFELYIPIKVQSQLVGIFGIGARRSEQPYTNEDIMTLSTLANQTAVAVENARLFTSEQNRRKEIDTLYNLSHQLVSTDDLDSLLRVVTHQTVDSIQATYARILLRDAYGNYICRAIYPEKNLETALRLGQIEPLVAEHFYNWVLRSGQSEVISINSLELHDEEKQALFLNHAGTICITPLSSAEENIGVLILGEFHIVQGAPFSSTGLRLVNAIATHTTSAIQRALLHDRLEESFLQTVVSLANAMDARDSYTGDHSARMADMASRVGEKLGSSSEKISKPFTGLQSCMISERSVSQMESSTKKVP